MKLIPQNQRWFLLHAASVLALGVAVPRQAAAVNVSFTIDPTLSYYHLVNAATDGPSPPAPLQLTTVLGSNVAPQAPGADTDALSGTINADLTGGVLTFSGTSTITLAANPNGPFLPSLSGTENFGIKSNVAALGGTLVNVNVYNSVGTVLSGTATNGQAPTAGSLILETTAGFQENSLTLSPVSLAGQSNPDVATTPVLLYEGGGIQTLVLPVIRINVAANGTSVTEGQIVATRAVPEPGTLALASVALVGLGLVARRRLNG